MEEQKDLQEQKTKAMNTTANKWLLSAFKYAASGVITGVVFILEYATQNGISPETANAWIDANKLVLFYNLGQLVILFLVVELVIGWVQTKRNPTPQSLEDTQPMPLVQADEVETY